MGNEEEKQMRLALVTKRLEGATEKMIKAAKHLAQKKASNPQGTKAIEQHLAAMEREEEKHGGYSTVNDLCATNKARGNKTKNDLCATNKARGNKNNYYNRNMNMAKKS